MGRSRGDETQTASVIYHYDTPDPDVPVGDGTAATARNTLGMLAWVEDLSGEEHTSYDARGRVETVIKRLPDPEFLSIGSPGAASRLVSYRTGFNYDSLDRVTTLTFPDSDQVGYRYNARNLLERITGGPGGSIISGIAYRPSDQLAQTDYGNGVQTTYDYDPRLRLRRLRTRHPELRREYIHFAYEFDGVSNIESIRDRRPGSEVPAGDPRRNTQIFEYDDLYRITRAGYSFALPHQPDANNGFITYRYDRIGNMLEQSSDIVHLEKGLSVTDLGEMSSGGTAGRFNRRGRAPNDPPGPHALTQIRTADPRPQTPHRIFPYDANGNMTVIDGLTNTWDFKDRLIAVENAEMRADYTYDYTDRRVLKRVFPKTSQTPDPRPKTPLSVLYPDKYFEVREHDAPAKYVWNGNTRVARVTGSLTTNLRTQRLRLWPGMNLVSPAVSLVADDVRRLHLSDPSLFTSPTSIESLHRWNSATLSWWPLAANEHLVAGTVLWLIASTNTTLSFTGTYAEPTNQLIAAGPNFFGGWGLQPLALSNALPAEVAAILFDSKENRWIFWALKPLRPQYHAPLYILPGEAAFVRADTRAQLKVTDGALRIRYYHQDHLGSTSSVTDFNGNTVEELKFYPYGGLKTEPQLLDVQERYRFTEKEQDNETGLYYFELRSLQTSFGRFISVDPVVNRSDRFQPKTLQMRNAYTYAGNNPIKYVDSTGGDTELAATDYNPDDLKHLQAGMEAMNEGISLDNGWYKVYNYMDGKFSLKEAEQTSKSENWAGRDAAKAHANLVQIEDGAVVRIEGFYNSSERALFWGMFSVSDRRPGIAPTAGKEPVVHMYKIKASKEAMEMAINAARAGRFNSGKSWYMVTGRQCQNFASEVERRAISYDKSQTLPQSDSKPLLLILPKELDER